MCCGLYVHPLECDKLVYVHYVFCWLLIEYSGHMFGYDYDGVPFCVYKAILCSVFADHLCSIHVIKGVISPTPLTTGEFVTIIP